MTEAEARKKWCPFARCRSIGEDGVSINREFPSRPADGCFCIASDCMAWSTEGPNGKHGWCGLVNSP